MGKFDKKETCEYCGEKMDAKHRNKRFCSDKCRVYSHREFGRLGFQPTHLSVPKNERIVITATSAKIGNPMPIRMEGEDAYDFAARKNEWKKHNK